MLQIEIQKFLATPLVGRTTEALFVRHFRFHLRHVPVGFGLSIITLGAP